MNASEHSDSSNSQPETSDSMLRQTFLQQLQAGDDAAMQELFERYSQRLVELAGHNIHPALIRRFDGEDVVQSVFRTFFRRQESGNFAISHTQQLWKLLVTITLCKTRMHARRHTADKRDVQSEQMHPSYQELLSYDPAPDEALALWEEIDVVLKGLPEQAGEILTARLTGETKSDIAEKLNVSRQTVHRMLNLLKERLDQRFEQYSA